jgi:GNAT superfamily N-acetyltransferase
MGRGARGGGPKVGFRLRRARLDDLPVLLEHRQKMWRDIGGWREPQLRRSLPAYERWVRAQWRRGKFLAFLAIDREGNALGSGAIWLFPTHPRVQRFTRELPYILSMYTEPRARRHGVATAIVQACIEWAERHRYPRLVLHASKMGLPVYERLGFELGREMRLNLPRTSTSRGARIRRPEARKVKRR